MISYSRLNWYVIETYKREYGRGYNEIEVSQMILPQLQFQSSYTDYKASVVIFTKYARFQISIKARK